MTGKKRKLKRPRYTIRIRLNTDIIEFLHSLGSRKARIEFVESEIESSKAYKQFTKLRAQTPADQLEHSLRIALDESFVDEYPGEQHKTVRPKPRAKARRPEAEQQAVSLSLTLSLTPQLIEPDNL
jgi:hypothetical protein